jgi:UPF0755 protein
MRHRLAGVIAVAASLATVAAVAGIFFLWLFSAFDRPGPLTAPRTVIVARDLTAEQVGRLLERQKIVADAWVFSLGVRVSGNASRLQPGEYEFGVAFSPRAAMDLLISGKRVTHRLVVPDAKTSAQVVKLLQGVDGLDGPIASVPAEGSLLPQTYQYFWGDTRQNLIERMKHALDETVTDLWDRRASDLPLADPKEAIVLASIIERETQIPKERALVASVLINRLDRGMKLESDVTVAYGIARADHLSNDVLPRPLTRDDLKRPTPYNTYVNTGLPPTPICNPGRDAIEAALHPAKTDYLFFSARGTQGTVFARTAQEHERNVAEMRSAHAEAGENEAMAPTEGTAP